MQPKLRPTIIRCAHTRSAQPIIGSSNYPQGLDGYIKGLPAPNTGPDVAQMEVRTPFAQVIVMAHEHRYSSMQAAEEYKKNPDTVQVRVQILNTATFAIASPMAAPQSPCHGMQRMNSVEDCFRTFRFAFGQGKDDLKPKSSYGVPIYSGGDNSSFLIGGNVWFVFRADDIHREDLFPGNL